MGWRIVDCEIVIVSHNMETYKMFMCEIELESEADLRYYKFVSTIEKIRGVDRQSLVIVLNRSQIDENLLREIQDRFYNIEYRSV